jgi:hypothetical protein
VGAAAVSCREGGAEPRTLGDRRSAQAGCVGRRLFLAAHRPIAPGHEGRSLLYVSKDRLGGIRAFAQDRKLAAEMVVDTTKPQRLDIRFAVPAEGWAPTERMDEIIRAARIDPQPRTKSALAGLVGGKRQTNLEAVDALVRRGDLVQKATEARSLPISQSTRGSRENRFPEWFPSGSREKWFPVPYGGAGNRFSSSSQPVPENGSPSPVWLVFPSEPGEADGVHPTRAELLVVASALEWPLVRVKVPGRSRPLVVAATPIAWTSFARASTPEGRLAAFMALEAVEAESQRQVTV